MVKAFAKSMIADAKDKLRAVYPAFGECNNVVEEGQEMNEHVEKLVEEPLEEVDKQCASIRSSIADM